MRETFQGTSTITLGIENFEGSVELGKSTNVGAVAITLSRGSVDFIVPINFCINKALGDNAGPNF